MKKLLKNLLLFFGCLTVFLLSILLGNAISLVLSVSLVLLLLGIWCFISFEENIGWYLIVFALFLGFGVGGVLVPVKSEYTQLSNYQVVKQPSYALVITDDKYYEVTDLELYNYLDNGTNLWIRSDINSYGLKLDNVIIKK